MLQHEADRAPAQQCNGKEENTTQQQLGSSEKPSASSIPEDGNSTNSAHSTKLRCRLENNSSSQQTEINGIVNPDAPLMVKTEKLTDADMIGTAGHFASGNLTGANKNDVSSEKYMFVKAEQINNEQYPSAFCPLTNECNNQNNHTRNLFGNAAQESSHGDVAGSVEETEINQAIDKQCASVFKSIKSDLRTIVEAKMVEDCHEPRPKVKRFVVQPGDTDLLHKYETNNKFVCNVCNRRFSSHRGLSIHQRSHTPKLNFCNQCRKPLTQQQFWLCKREGHKINDYHHGDVHYESWERKFT